MSGRSNTSFFTPANWDHVEDMPERLDVLVVGGGIVGLAVARSLALAGRDVVLIERNTRLAAETSARNSQVIHAGLYYPVNSLKARTSRDGNAALYRYCAERGVATQRCGKIIAATSPAEVPTLKALMTHARKNGLGDLVFLSAHDAKAMEPGLACSGACLSPSTGVIDALGFVHALEAELLALGTTVVLRTTVEAVSTAGSALTVTTREESGQTTEFQARTVINAAGLGASQISKTLLSGAHTPPKTYYGKGHYFGYTGTVPFSRLIYPMPTANALGIHLTRGIDGAVKFGPDLSWTKSLDYAFDDENGARRTRFITAIQQYWPDLETEKLHPDMTGIRPKLSPSGAPSADFTVHNHRVHGVPGYVALYGIESPGLTASLALADHVAALADTSI